MNALRIRKLTLYSARKYPSRLSQTLIAPRETRLYATNPAPENTPHTPDTYQKDEQVNPPASSKTHVVSEDNNGEPRTQRPFEAPTGSYTTVDDSKPYDEPADNPQQDKSKLGYGGTERGGGGAKDVDGNDGPQGGSGKMGRQ